jgi:hypothetical protein
MHLSLGSNKIDFLFRVIFVILICKRVKVFINGGLPTNETIIPELLKNVAYASTIHGKWHL